ncbi:unnamed protein product [Camellia sinensis]
MKGEVGEAPPPEPPKEETIAVVAEANAVNKVVTVEGEENKGEEQSLGFLLNECARNFNEERVVPPPHVTDPLIQGCIEGSRKRQRQMTVIGLGRGGRLILIALGKSRVQIL